MIDSRLGFGSDNHTLTAIDKHDRRKYIYNTYIYIPGIYMYIYIYIFYIYPMETIDESVSSFQYIALYTRRYIQQ